MGNHVGVEREPATLNEILESKDEKNKEHVAKVKFNNKNNKHEFGSSLHLWRFFPDWENTQDIKNAPVSLTDNFKAFDSSQCYLILHIFLEGQKYPSHTPPTSPIPETEVTITSLLSSSSDTLTPRGLSNCLEDAFLANLSTKGSETGLNYNIYIWNGKNSDNMTRAVAMAKRCELVKALETRKLTQTLFLRGDKVPLTSVFRYDLNGGNGLEGVGNHLLHQLLRRDSSEFVGKSARDSGGSTTPNGKSATSFSRLNQIFPESASSPTTPTSPSKDLQGRSRSEGSLKELLEHKPSTKNDNNKETDNNETVTNSTDSEKDPSPKKKKDEDDDSSAKKKKKKKKKKSKSDRSNSKPSLSKQMSLSQPSLVSKMGLPALDLSKKEKPPIAKLPLTIKGFSGMGENKLSLDKVTNGNLGHNGGGGTDLMQGGTEGAEFANAVDPSFQLSENEIRSEKLKRFDTICSKITDDLFLGSQTVSKDLTLLHQEGVTHVLNCAGSICPEYHPSEFVYRTLYLTDGVKEDILCLLYDVIEWIDEVVSHKGKVFIHCQQGVSRSSAIMIGYLMWKKDWTYEEAQLFVKARRGVSSPNAGFICQLLNLEKRLHEAKRETRIYHVTKHSQLDTNLLVGKNTGRFPLSELTKGNSSSCYIVQVPECFYIWVGSNCGEEFFDVAKQTVRRVQAFEKATQNVKIVHQGAEGTEFKEFIAKVGQQ